MKDFMKDHLTSMETISAFAKRIGAELTVMSNGEHWFHTEEQMRFLYRWIENSVSVFGKHEYETKKSEK